MNRLRLSDLGLGGSIILILAVTLIPLPTFLMDVFLAMNILGGLVILFVALYMRVQGARPWMQSIIAAMIVLGFVTLVFEYLLDYSLYRGVIFDPKGFGAW